MKAILFSLTMVYICAQAFSLSILPQKKSVFDLIPVHDRQHLEEKDLESKTMKTRINLEKSLINLWNQYHGNWMGMNGKIELLKNRFETQSRKKRNQATL